MKSYILFSAFGDEIRHHLICQSKEDAETKLVEFASNHIIDRIGKCNFVNTLENNVPTKLCPVGYVVKYARRDTDADVDVPKLSANYINQIYIMSTRDVEEESSRIKSASSKSMDITPSMNLSPKTPLRPPPHHHRGQILLKYLPEVMRHYV